MSMHVNAEAALALLKSPRPDINELEDIVGDIPQDDRRATEVVRRVRSLLNEGAFLAAARCLGSRFLLTDRQLTTVSFEGDARPPQLALGGHRRWLVKCQLLREEQTSTFHNNACTNPPFRADRYRAAYSGGSSGKFVVAT